MPMELVRSQPPDDARHTEHREEQCAYITKHFNGDECKLEAIAVVVSGLNDLYMPSSTLLFIRVLSKMLDMEVELPAELMDNPYLCAWFMREFAYWLLQYVDDYCKLSQDE